MKLPTFADDLDVPDRFIAGDPDPIPVLNAILFVVFVGIVFCL